MSFSQTLFSKLTNLVKNNSAFFSKDHISESNKTSIYRIFNYRLASYTDFTQDGALECRGVMFDVTDLCNPVLKSLPMEKFFNLYENPFTMDLDLTTVTKIYEKADGSLISTYIEDDKLLLKSKGSIGSEHCIAAMKWLDEPVNKQLKEDIETFAKNNKTVNMEWCSLEQRIVLLYPKNMLKILNIRDNETGEYCTELMTPKMLEHRVELLNVDDVKGGAVEFVKNIPDMKDDIEGFVIYLRAKENTTIEQKVKVKTNLYFAKHTLFSNIRNPKVLFELILDETIDDVRAKYHDDKGVMDTINDMQIKIDKIYNDCVKTVEEFYDSHKDLSRKDFAIKAKAELSWLHFLLIMKKYTDKTVDYKGILKTKWKQLGFDDMVVQNDD